MKEITLKELKDVWLRNKIKNCDFRGIRNKFMLAEKYGLEQNPLMLAPLIKEGKRIDTWGGILEGDNIIDYFYTYELLKKGVLEYLENEKVSEVIIQFGYNLWEDNDYDENTTERVLIKVD